MRLLRVWEPQLDVDGSTVRVARALLVGERGAGARSSTRSSRNPRTPAARARPGLRGVVGRKDHAGRRIEEAHAARRPDATLRPDAALVLQGSTFDGSLDERRVSGIANLYPGPSRLGAHFEVSAFDAGNPWGAKRFALTAAGIDSSVRMRPFTLEGRFELRQPERSRWLASFLPTTWFCPTVTTTNQCDGTVSTFVYGAVDAGVELGRFSLFAGGTLTGDLTLPDAPSTLGAFTTVRVVKIAEVLRIDASGAYSKGTYVRMASGSAGTRTLALRRCPRRLGVLSRDGARVPSRGGLVAPAPRAARSS